MMYDRNYKDVDFGSVYHGVKSRVQKVIEQSQKFFYLIKA